ncbi:MAG: VCBS repeat-containing protein, partial [Acidobacteria bacterium]
ISGDGKADLLWRNTQSGATAEWVMDGVAVSQGPLIDTGPPLVWQTQ